MTRVLDRIRSGRLGLIGIVFLILLVLVVAHALVMGGGHGDEMACGSCVVVVATGMAAVIALWPRRALVSTAPVGRVPIFMTVGSMRSSRPPLLRSVVLRL
jgi:hypothetical protein